MTTCFLIDPALAAVSRPGQDGPDTQRDDAGDRGVLDIDVDVFQAEEADVDAALDDLSANVGDQLAELEAAQADLDSADAAVEQAAARVAETEGRIAELTALSDDVVIESFVNPPSESSLDALDADTLSDAAIKQSILDTQASHNADILTELGTAREEFEIQQAGQQEAEEAAAARASEKEAELADLAAAQSQQAVFVAQVEARLDRQLAEADALQDLDPAMAEQLRDRQAELATRIDEIRDARELEEALAALQLAQAQAEADAQAEAERLAAERAAAAAGDPSGTLADVACPGGGSITVDSALASSLEALLAAASADGLTMCGGGYRSIEEQIQRRRENCGTSDYAIYEMPSSDCSPPTARPGASQHELGLAIDFTCGGTLIQSDASPCFQWLSANAANYGLYNLPSERWHWSTTGN
jgi:LAS superfamily LD-carboxypeptidase LdcB